MALKASGQAGAEADKSHKNPYHQICQLSSLINNRHQPIELPPAISQNMPEIEQALPSEDDSSASAQILLIMPDNSGIYNIYSDCKDNKKCCKILWV
jgi:hypothetical protein